jgi:hypothetical protein
MCSGLDNKCTLYPLSLDEDPATRKRAIATHTSYLSCCKFVSSDHQVNRMLTNTYVQVDFSILERKPSSTLAELSSVSLPFVYSL